MTLLPDRLTELLLPLGWMFLWFAGGVLILANTFRTRRHETTLLGFGLGLVLQTWLANWIGRVVEPLPAFWLSALAVFLAGVGLTFALKNWPAVRQNLAFPPAYWLVFALCAYVFFMIGRGLAIYDDYQNLPVASFLAAGNLPPRFMLNPAIHFDYHYLMLLNAAQWMRVADLFPWTALDLTRGIFFGLGMVYAAFFGYRLTHSRAAGWLTALVIAFSGGVRWLFLFLPAGLIEKISAHIPMMGTGLGTAESLQAALTQPWLIEGGGPLAFPFAFANGFNGGAIMGHTGTGNMGLVISLLILLLFGRWKSKWSMLVLSLLLAAAALVIEIWFVFFLAAAGLILLIEFIRSRKHLAPEFWFWCLFLLVLPGVLSLVQGGVLTGVARGLLPVLGLAPAAAAEAQYFSMRFPIRWPPTIISAHLGRLELTNPAQLLAAMLEVGPIFLLIPLYLGWSYKAYRRHDKTLFGILGVGTIASLLALFVEYEGSAGISASTRLFSFSMGQLSLFAVPLLWLWLKQRSAAMCTAVIGLASLTLVSGIVLFAIESIAIQKPVLSYYLTPLDASVEDRYWDVFEEDALVFDPVPPRAAAIFARATRSNSTWYKELSEFEALVKDPDPTTLREAGYSYAYWSRDHWREVRPLTQRAYTDACVRLVYEVSDWTGDFRRVYDIRACGQ